MCVRVVGVPAGRASRVELPQNEKRVNRYYLSCEMLLASWPAKSSVWQRRLDMQGMVSTRRILRTIALCGGLLLDARPSCSQTSAEAVNKKMDMEKISALLQQ